LRCTYALTLSFHSTPRSPHFSPRFSFPVLVFRRLSFLLHLPSFPTRRSSDLTKGVVLRHLDQRGELLFGGLLLLGRAHALLFSRDRKSTRLNSSHQIISYAVFCLKKKTKKHKRMKHT